MHFTLHVEGDDLDNPARLKRAAQALLVLAGENPHETIELRLDAGPMKQALAETIKQRVRQHEADALDRSVRAVTDIVAAHRDRMAGEGPELGEQLERELAHAASDPNPGDDLPPQDDPAAILAAAQAGGVPLDDPAAVLAAAAAQASTSAPAGTPATSTELDASGLPWDERIHSGSRAKVKDGTWRKRSKLEDGVYEKIEAELRLHYPKPVAHVPPPPPAGAAGGGSDFAALVQRLHAGFARQDDPVTKDQQIAAMKHFGLSGLEELSKRPDLFEGFAGMLGI